MQDLPSLFILTLFIMPLLATAVLGVYPLALWLFHRWSLQEYEQAVRAPAWFVVVMGGGVCLLATAALLQSMPAPGPVFIGMPFSHGASPALFVDAYTLWGSALIGLVLSVSAWVPAARRSLTPDALPPFLATLLLAWLALFTLSCAQLALLSWSWLLLIAGVTGLTYYLFRPHARLVEWEPLLVLGLAMLLGSIGLGWLRALTHNADLRDLWMTPISAPATAVHGAMFLMLLGLLGPAIYLPWWIWPRREEETHAWAPAMLLLALSGTLTALRLCFLMFALYTPRAGQAIQGRFFGMLAGWGLLALLIGAGGLAWQAMPRWRALLLGGVYRARDASFRAFTSPRALGPLTMVAAGLLLLGIAAGVSAPEGAGVAGALWLLLAWIGALTLLLMTTGLLPVLFAGSRLARGVVITAAWVALATLVAVPVLPGWRGIIALQPALASLGVPGWLVGLALLVTAVSVGMLLPRWVAVQVAPSLRPGASWGIFGPLLLAAILLIFGLLGGTLGPVFTAIRLALLQRY